VIEVEHDEVIYLDGGVRCTTMQPVREARRKVFA
jgi:hypothetical protein